MRSLPILLAFAILVSGCVAPSPPVPPPVPPPTSAEAGGQTIVAIQPAAPPQQTLLDWLGIGQIVKFIGCKLGRTAGLLARLFPAQAEALAALNGVPDPEKLKSDNPAVQANEQAKALEAEAAETAAAIRQLGKRGCGVLPGVDEVLLAAMDDYTPEVRLAAVNAVRASAGDKCITCRPGSCCTPEIRKKLRSLAFDIDEKTGCPLEPSSDVRIAARNALRACGPEAPAPPLVPEPDPDLPTEGPTPEQFPDLIPQPDDPPPQPPGPQVPGAPPSPGLPAPGAPAIPPAAPPAAPGAPAIPAGPTLQSSVPPSPTPPSTATTSTTPDPLTEILADDDIVIATIDGEPITTAAIRDGVNTAYGRMPTTLPPSARRLWLRTLVRRELNAAINARLLHRAALADETFGAIKPVAATSIETERELTDRWLAHRLQVEVTEAELRARFEATEYPTRPAALAWEEAIANVVDFESAAEAEDAVRRFRERATNADPGAVDRTGFDRLVPRLYDFGEPTRSDSAAVARFLETARTRDVSPVLRDAGTFRIVRVVGRREARVVRFEEVVDEIREGLVRERHEESRRALLRELRDAATIWAVTDGRPR